MPIRVIATEVAHHRLRVFLVTCLRLRGCLEHFEHEVIGCFIEPRTYCLQSVCCCSLQPEFAILEALLQAWTVIVLTSELLPPFLWCRTSCNDFPASSLLQRWDRYSVLPTFDAIVVTSSFTPVIPAVTHSLQNREVMRSASTTSRHQCGREQRFVLSCTVC